jgi:hypothetical protein
MRGKYQFVIKANNESRYHLLFRAPLAQERAAGLLAGFLEQKNIHIHTIADSGAKRELTRIRPVSASSVDRPVFSHANLWPRIADKLSSRGERPEPPANHNPGTLLNYLRERNLSENANIRLEFLDQENPSTSISLSLRTTKLRLQPPAVLLEEEMARPCLFGLLELNGYDAFRL